MYDWGKPSEKKAFSPGTNWSSAANCYSQTFLLNFSKWLPPAGRVAYNCRLSALAGGRRWGRCLGAFEMLLQMLAAVLSFASAQATCTDDNSCQLNGKCVAGMCRCDQGWQGADCGVLHLRAKAHVAYGYSNASKVSCWGGGPPVYDPATSRYQLLVSQIAGRCGMSTWSRLSTSVRATAHKPEGPYEFAETIVGSESHNTLYAYSPTDRVHLMYTIFEGTWPQSCNPAPTCTDGTTPGGRGLHPPPLPNNTCTGGPGGRPVVHWAKSFAGPWHSVGPAKVDWGQAGHPPNGGASNPSPYIFPNGE
eukprot:COSAG01_NODE_1964_length_8779_cov_447.550922_2_plen_306_part_00